MPSLVSQAVSQPVNNIYWVPNERSAARQGGDMGSGLEGQPGQWRSQREDRRHDYKMLEKQHHCKGSRGWSPSPLLSTCGEAAHAKGLFISELSGCPSNPGREVAFTSPSLSFLTWKINSNECQGAAKPGSVQLDPQHRRSEGTENWQGRASENRNASTTAVPDSSPFQVH